MSPTAAFVPSLRLMRNSPKLSRRQRQVLEPLLQGHGEKRVAYLLNLSVNTVHTYVRQIYALYGVHSKGELAFQLLQERSERGAPEVECSC